MLTNRSAPPATVTPVLVYPDVRAAVAWLEAAFGFEERVRIGEGHRAQLRAGPDGAVVVAEPGGDRVVPAGGGSAHLVKVRVEDVDAHCARARAAGGEVVREPETYPFGERQYSLVDPGGHAWTFTQSVADVDPMEWGGELVGD